MVVAGGGDDEHDNSKCDAGDEAEDVGTRALLHWLLW
jgi:hypothetical protein